MRPTQPSSRSARSGFLERRKALRLAAALPWAILVAGCGQKGPLYLAPEPEEEEDDDDEENQTSAVPRVPGSRLG